MKQSYETALDVLTAVAIGVGFAGLLKVFELLLQECRCGVIYRHKLFLKIILQLFFLCIYCTQI